MKSWQTLALSSLLATTLAACSSGNSSGTVPDDQPGATTGGTTTGTVTAGTTTGTVTAGTTTGTGTAGTTTGTGTAGTTTGTGTGTAGTTTGADTGGAGAGLPRVDVVETLPGDPFGYTLELDTPAAPTSGVPSVPRNLRIDLVSSDWAEFSWAPSSDDVAVTKYVIERDDGQEYELTPALAPGLALDPGTYEEYVKYWDTTSFIDCNSTRFAFVPGSQKDLDGPWNCANTRPTPGETYSYTIRAEDGDGNSSASSEPLSFRYASEEAADLTAVADFIDDFDLVWSDEFDGGALDPANWQTALRGGSGTHINGEQQYFVDRFGNDPVAYDPFEFNGETLKINAVRPTAAQAAALPASCSEPDRVLDNDPSRERCEFLSGALSSHDRMSFVFGYVEGRIRTSEVSGALSSFYLLNRYPGENRPDAEPPVYQYHAPEIDIIEYLGVNPFGDPDAFQTYHFADVNTGITRSSPTMNHAKEDGGVYGGEFHTFGVLWEPQLVIWYIDGVEVRRLSGPQISQQPMNIVNYLVAGSGWAPEPEAGGEALAMEVDYIRVYQREQFQGSLNVSRP